MFVAEFDEFRSDQRRDRGLVIVLPGIEGYSRLNRRIARGLAQGGVPGCIEIFDWTYGRLWQLWSLRSRKRHAEQAKLIVERISEYQEEYPGRPVHLVGHSGGGAMIAFTMEVLPPPRKITSGVMLVPALSPEYDLSTTVSRTEHGIWNYCSVWDFMFLGLGTLLFGTADGRHRIAAGNVGFATGAGSQASDRLEKLVRNVPYQKAMRQWGHSGGHLSVTRETFVAQEIAPLLMGDCDSPD